MFLAQTDQTAVETAGSQYSAVEQAFNAVLDAEKAGANVTQLLAKLNTAGELLADAQNALNSGNNVANITSKAENATQIAVQVKEMHLICEMLALLNPKIVFG